MKRAKLVPIAASAAFGLILVGGVAVMAQPNDDATPETPAATESATLKAEEPKVNKLRNPAGHGFGGGLGFGVNPEQLAALLDEIPAEMRSDLAELLTAPEADRVKLIEDMIAEAKDGGYGEELANQLDQAEKMGKEFGEKAKKQWDDMPAELKADLENLRNVKGEERAAAMKKIAEDAKAGKYGDDIKEQFGKLGGMLEGFGHMQGKNSGQGMKQGDAKAQLGKMFGNI